MLLDFTEAFLEPYVFFKLFAVNLTKILSF